MANTKISALTNGNPAQAGDVIPIDRAGANFSVTAGSIAALATGTVTSFSAGNVGSIINSSVATPTTTPSLTFALATQSENVVWAGPTTGSAAIPTFRALVAADIPALPYGTGTVTGVSFTGGLISIASPTTTPALTVAGTSGGIPYFSGASTWASSALLSSGGVMLGGGVAAAPLTSTQLTFSAPTLTIGLSGTSSGILALAGSTSGYVTITAPAVSDTITNPIIISNSVTLASGTTLSASTVLAIGTATATETRSAYYEDLSNSVGYWTTGTPGWLFTDRVASNVAITIQGAASQSAPLLNLQNSSAVVLVSFSSNGSLTLPRINLAGADFAGQATVTAGTTTKAVAFSANYVGTGQPVVILTPTSDPLASGVPVGYWVTYSGSAGAWTGFTVNIQTALAGNVTFNYIVVGQA